MKIQEYFVSNAPHHRELITFPHHKYIGSEDRPAPSDQPSLNQVTAEVNEYLTKTK